MASTVGVPYSVEYVEPRGCGRSPIAGGVYWQTMIGLGGVPVDSCLIDPPIPVPEDWRLSAQGVFVFRHEKTGVYHIADLIGEKFYPDLHGYWFGEVHRNGVSRRLPRSIEFEKLTKDSMIFLCHRKALVRPEDYALYRQYYDGHEWKCPQCRDGHPEHLCVDFWRHDLTPNGNNELQVRMVGAAEYEGYATPPGLKPEYTTAMFAKLPATRLAVYHDNLDRTHEVALDKATKSGIRVVEVEARPIEEKNNDE